MDTFQDKIVVVTGGNSGIGYATAKEFAAQGATVVITGRRKEAIEAAAAEIGAIPMLSDQGNLQDINALGAAVADRFGKVDVLFINAGITGTMGLIENAQADNFDTVMDINFRGAYFTLSRFITLLRDGVDKPFKTDPFRPNERDPFRRLKLTPVRQGKLTPFANLK